MNEPGCESYRWAIFKEHGYSNWTVTSTTLHCMYGHSVTELDVATYEHYSPPEDCDSYCEGSPLEIDVETDLPPGVR